FWVKGDGSNHLGALQFVWNEDYAQRYDYGFSISGTEWTKITVLWSDLIPALSNANSKPLDPKGDRQPSKLGAMWIGKWWYWRDYAAHSYALDDFRLEPTIAQETKDYRPAGAPLARVHAKLKAGKPITVVTMGDSLTDYKHNSNSQTNWPKFFTAAIKETYKSDVTLENPAIGGTELRQNLTMMPRWLVVQPKPDLVTVCFGGNDYASGMRGEMFTAAMKDAIQRIRRATKGESDILVITSMPSVESWDTMNELAEACRVAAKDQNAGLCDGFSVFHEVGKDNKERLFADDKVHLGKPGQEAMSKAVVDAIEKNAK
nr:SGNH/GDSL hydrolase family protein [Planctomycetota bacterium]